MNEPAESRYYDSLRCRRATEAEQRELLSVPRETCNVLLNDALRVLSDVCVHLALELTSAEPRTEEADELLKEVTDILYRGGRL